jgi:adenylate cyclase
MADAFGEELTAGCPAERKAILTGEAPKEIRRRRWFGRIPANPRCMLCYAPFGAPGSYWMRAIGRGPFSKNPRFCERCFHGALAVPGGLELEIATLFVDVRGSTPLAERVGPSAFATLLDRYYGLAMAEMVATQGFVEITGDEVYAFYLPAFTGSNVARAAIETAERILRKVTDLPLGAGVNVGTAWVGVVGGGGVSDFRSIGDPVNVGARLVAQAAAGECLISEAAYQQAELTWTNLESRELEVAGKQDAVRARVMRIA